MNENCEERRAKEWLESQGYTDIRDLSKEKKDPPDFVVENRIAVEIQRLTDASATKGKGSGIDKPLFKIISKILKEAGEPPGGHDVYVLSGLLDDELPPPKVTRRQVKQAVDEYTEILSEAFSQSGGNPVKEPTQLECGKFSHHFGPRPALETGKFVLMQATTAMGRQVGAVSIDDINRCIVKKTDKIKDKINCYPEWWLVLVDRERLTPLGLGWDWDTSEKKWEENEWQQIRNSLVGTDPWSRVVVISLMDDLIHIDLIEQST